MAGPHPEVRLLAWLVAVTGTFAAAHVTLLTAGWLFTLALLAVCGQLRRHMGFLIPVLAPLAVVLAIIWGVVVEAPPDLPRGSAPDLGLLYAARVTLRLGIVAGVSQLAFLTISAEGLWPVARRLGLRGDALGIVLSSFALASGMGKVVDQTLTALKARGAITPNRPWTRLVVLPTLIAGIWNRLVADQIQRVEYKRAPQRTFDRVAEISVGADWSMTWSLAAISIAFGWLLLGIASALVH